MKNIILFLISIMSLVIGLPAHSTQDKFDQKRSESEISAQILMDEVLNSRAEVNSGELKGVWSRTSHNGVEIEFEHQFHMRFDEDRRFVESVVDYSKPEESLAYKRVAFDGYNLIRYARDSRNPYGTVALLPLDASLDGIFFMDPRLVGVTTYFDWRNTFDHVRFSDFGDLKARLIEGEGGEVIYEVDLITPDNEDAKIWFDNHVPARIAGYFFEYHNYTEKAEFSYDMNKQPWLPTTISIVECNAVDMFAESRFEIHEYDNLKTDLPEKYSISDVRPKPGASVMDVKARTVMGYWDGKGGYTDSIPAETVRTARHNMNNDPIVGIREIIRLLVIGGFLIISIWIFIRIKR